MNILAIIPARQGSVRVPGKNLRQLGDKPLIHWTILAAQGISEIKRVFVSTDSEEIRDSALSLGLSIPMLRPEELARNESPSIDVVTHTINFFSSIGENYDYVLLLQPTSPFRTKEHIQEAIELLKTKKADGIVSVTKCSHSPLWTNQLPENMSMDNFLNKEYKNVRSQDLPTFYKLNGAIYIANTKKILKENSLILEKNCFAYVMDDVSSLDIDNELDLLIAESLLKTLQ